MRVKWQSVLCVVAGMALALLVAGHRDGTPLAMGAAMAQDTGPRPPVRQISTADTA